MLETFTPAVCGSRKRQLIAQALFTVAAVATSAALGLALGFAGDVLGGRQAVLAAAALALVAAARELGLVRFPLPQARRQVPERWRFELPLPLWATGYGAGLGAGFFTFQPVSTFWVACAGALALARPLPAALCLSLYGAGRAAMVIWPRRREGDPTAAVERLTRRRGALLRANAVALVACAVLLAVAPAAGGALVARSALDPSASGGNVAFATKGGDVVVRPASGGDVTFSDASQPALSGGYLAYVDGEGIRVVRWADGTEVGGPVSRPALDWPNLAFVRREPGHWRLVVRNLVSGQRKLPARTRSNIDLGRPSLRNGRLAWHVVSRSESKIFVRALASQKRRIIARTKIGRLGNPSLNRTRIVWVDARSGATYLRQGRIGSRTKRVIAKIKSRSLSYWTTSISGSATYFTRWTVGTGAAQIHRRPN
jgi:cytochrome c biogenesis protein CcdA